ARLPHQPLGPLTVNGADGPRGARPRRGASPFPRGAGYL
ncbi:MAG: hypothetical protein AVDCRST_MAG88-961, partial [uncultured Thermomicrobiales bacterium]